MFTLRPALGGALVRSGCTGGTSAVPVVRTGSATILLLSLRLFWRKKPTPTLFHLCRGLGKRLQSISRIFGAPPIPLCIHAGDLCNPLTASDPSTSCSSKLERIVDSPSYSVHQLPSNGRPYVSGLTRASFSFNPQVPTEPAQYNKKRRRASLK